MFSPVLFRDPDISVRGLQGRDKKVGSAKNRSITEFYHPGMVKYAVCTNRS